MEEKISNINIEVASVTAKVNIMMMMLLKHFKVVDDAYYDEDYNSDCSD